MQFDEFVRQIDAAIRVQVTVDREEVKAGNTAMWASRARSASVAQVPPRNLSVTLLGDDGQPHTRWFPIDAALVPTVSKRIAAFLSEA